MDSFLTIDIGSNDYTELLNLLLKYTTILIVFQMLMYAEYGGKSLGRIGFLKRDLFNKHFMNVLMFVLVGVSTYELVVKKLIQFS